MSSDAATHEPTPPVAYMLVQTIASTDGGPDRLRTELNWGYINNETVHKITKGGTWRLGGVVGPFATPLLAQAFLRFWREGTPDDQARTGKSRTVRGPVVRASLAIALAETLRLSVYISFEVVTNTRLLQYDCRIQHGQLVASHRSLTTGPG